MGVYVGSYATSEDVKNIRAQNLGELGDDEIGVFIAGAEAQINATLKAQGYPSVPATGENDKALLGMMVRQYVAAQVWLATVSQQNVPQWVDTWLTAWRQFIRALSRGEVVLMDQEPTYPAQTAALSTITTWEAETLDDGY